MIGNETSIARPSAKFLRECLEYRDGSLYWKVRPVHHFGKPADQQAFNTKTAGKIAGKLGKDGYIHIGLRVNGLAISMAAHRVVWALHHGRWPTLHIDHINRVRNDNRIENLREVTPAENAKNSSWKCVHPYVHPARNGQYQAQVKIGPKQVHIGVFESEQAAHEHRQMVLTEMDKVARRLAKKSTVVGGRPRKSLADGETLPSHTPAPDSVKEQNND